MVECADSETALEQQLSSWWLWLSSATRFLFTAKQGWLLWLLFATVQQLTLHFATHHCCENQCHPSASYLTSIFIIIIIITIIDIIIITIVNIITDIIDIIIDIIHFIINGWLWLLSAVIISATQALLI